MAVGTALESVDDIPQSFGGSTPRNTTHQDHMALEKNRILSEYSAESLHREESLSAERMRQEKLMLDKLREKRLRRLQASVRIDSRDVRDSQPRPLSASGGEDLDDEDSRASFYADGNVLEESAGMLPRLSADRGVPSSAVGSSLPPLRGVLPPPSTSDQSGMRLTGEDEMAFAQLTSQHEPESEEEVRRRADFFREQRDRIAAAKLRRRLLASE